MTNPLVKTAQTLRKRYTDAEMLLWRHIRTKQLEGIKFRRQEPIGKYIVDFVCYEKKIVIEVDGGQHLESEQDKERDKFFLEQDYKVLRFWNNEVLTNIQGVLEAIRNKCLYHPPLNPLPSREGKQEVPHQGRGSKRYPIKGGEVTRLK